MLSMTLPDNSGLTPTRTDTSPVMHVRSSLQMETIYIHYLDRKEYKSYKIYRVSFMIALGLIHITGILF